MNQDKKKKITGRVVIFFLILVGLVVIKAYGFERKILYTALRFYRKPPSQINIHDLKLVARRKISKEYTCLANDHCIGIYTTPWCPSCRASLKWLQKVQASGRFKGIGFMSVVGKDQKDKIIDYSKKISGEVYYDFEDSFFKELNVRVFPTWYCWDKEGKLINWTYKSKHGDPSSSSVSRFISELCQIEKNLK